MLKARNQNIKLVSQVVQNYALELTQAAAIACLPWIGRGDEKAADAAAVNAMRSQMNKIPMSGRIVIGEGERDEAPMLFINEEVGMGGEALDIAVDPLEGTTLCAHSAANSIAVLAIAPKGTLLHAPDVYMKKIAVGSNLPLGVVHVDDPVEKNLKSLASAKKCAVSDLRICILQRDRHNELIAKVREAGAYVQLIQDGDVFGVIATCKKSTKVDMYIGSGGAPEGVLAAAALATFGGQIQGKLLFRNDAEIERARRAGITDLNHVYDLKDMVSDDVVFAATGVTDGWMLKGVKKSSCGVKTHSLITHRSLNLIREVRDELCHA